MSDSLIRHATEEDMPQLACLLDQLGYPTSVEDLAVRFQRFIQNPGFRVVVYEQNHQILGFMAWSRADLFVQDKVRWRIEALVVLKPFRGQSVGKKLMAFVEDMAHREPYPVVIELTSGLRRAPEGTHAFYENLGYRNEGPKAKLYLRKDFSEY